MNVEQREKDARSDARRMCAMADFIVAQGETAFFDPEDPRGRLAAKALMIDLATALQVAPGWQAKNAETWAQLEKTRDRHAHFYEKFDYRIQWGVMANRLPALRLSLED